MLDRAVFMRPIAHRGLHDGDSGTIVENTTPAFLAAIEKNYGIECDVRSGNNGLAIVFHDATTGRLINEDRKLATLTKTDLTTLTFQSSSARIPTLDETLQLINGRVPLIIEVKSDWDPLNQSFLEQVAGLVSQYDGPIALKSFDPAVMIALKDLAPNTPRGLVSMDFESDAASLEKFGVERCRSLSHFLEAGRADASFISYDVTALPTPVTRYIREAQRLPLFAWTVRTTKNWAVARKWADAAIFEGQVPATSRWPLHA